jgi:Zn-dependent peptidase ImmA (M78 family)
MTTEGPELDIGPRLKRARLARGMSLQQVADRLARPVTRAALSKYERGETVPRADVLVDLGQVLGFPGSHFLEPPGERGDVVEWLGYRRQGAPGRRQSERIQAWAGLAAGAYDRLLDLLHPEEEVRFPPPRNATAAPDAEEAAESLRSRWGLGSGPIESVVACAEDAGALVLAWTDPARFDALTGRTGSSRPVIVLNLDRPEDRRRSSLAHELGRLVLEMSSLAQGEQQSLAHRFAAAFVAPREAALHELGRRRARITLAELEHLSAKYGLSVQAWIRRARDLGVITEQAHRGWQVRLRSQDLVRETAGYAGQETPSRLRVLAVQALAEGLVDRTWVRSFCPEAAEQVDDARESAWRALLRKPVEERRRILEEAADAASDAYTDDPELAEFLGFDDSTEDDDETGEPTSPATR